MWISAASRVRRARRWPRRAASSRAKDTSPASPGMALWRERLFAAMARNAGNAADYFNLPANRVIELGTKVEI